MSHELFEIDRLRYVYPGAEAAHVLCPAQRREALAGITLTIPRGVRLALLGANGSGKSTLLMHLNGTLRPSAGEVRCDGRPIEYSRAGLLALRRRVALVFQDPNDQLFAGTLAQDVSFGPLNLGLADAEVRIRVAEALEAVGLRGLDDLPIHMLSHGQRQRAALAGALALCPEVLLLDEPTAGLDPEGVRALAGQLDRLHDRGVTVVLTTHDISFASRWADIVHTLAAGSLAPSPDQAFSEASQRGTS